MAVYWWLPSGSFFTSQTSAEASSSPLISAGSSDGAADGTSDGGAVGVVLGVGRGLGSALTSGASSPNSPHAESSRADESSRAVRAMSLSLRLDMISRLLFDFLTASYHGKVRRFNRFSNF